jgi:hypothetical protein
MAYNFPSYQPYYQPQYYQAAQPQSQSGIIWVSGIAGAKAYMVPPNATVQLWDSESQTIFLKSADASGMPSMKILDYTIRDGSGQPQKAEAAPDYATKDDLKALEARIEKRLRGNKGGGSTHEQSAV